MNEQDIKLLFDKLSTVEAEHSPEFAPMVAAANRNIARKLLLKRASGAAVAIMAVGLVMMPLFFSLSEARLETRSLPAPLPWQSRVLLSEWEAPSDVVLRSSGIDPFFPRSFITPHNTTYQ